MVPAPMFCGEFGCFAPFAKHEERVNWYRIVTNLLAERKFPEDLDLDIVKAMGMNVIEK